jgi:RNA polymerase sigma factor (sigma-70 family)
VSRKTQLHPAISIHVTPDLDATEALILQAQSGNVSARNKVITTWYPWLQQRAKNFAFRNKRPDLIEDLTQAAFCGDEKYVSGLYRAISGFNPTAGTRFSTYATYWITEAMTKCLLRAQNKMQSPRMAQQDSRIRKLAGEIQRYLGRPPTYDEIRAAWDDAKYPLDKTMARAFEDQTLLELDDPGDENAVEHIEHAVLLRECIDAFHVLPERLAYLMQQRYIYDKSVNELALECGVSRQAINQAEIEALKLLREALE